MSIKKGISRHIIFISAILLLLCISGCSEKVDNGLHIICDNNDGIFQIYYDQQPILSGGKPVFSGQGFAFDGLTETSNALLYQYDAGQIELSYKINKEDQIIGFWLKNREESVIRDSISMALSFSKIPEYSVGLSIQNYLSCEKGKLANRVDDPADLEKENVKMFLWKFKDERYGLILPMDTKDINAGLGNEGDLFGIKTCTHKVKSKEDIPLLIMGTGDDPFLLIENVYRQACEWMGYEYDHHENILLADPLQYLGWSTSKVDDLSSASILKSLNTFRNKGFQLGSVLIDKGWNDATGQQDNTCNPDENKFPQGLKPLINKIKKEYSIPFVGIGYPSNHFKDGSPDSLASFYNSWYKYLTNEGVSFLKLNDPVDRNKPDALCVSLDKYYKYAIVQDFKWSAKPNHFIQGAYFGISDEGYPLCDAFDSYQPDAEFQALLRTFNNKPVFISDLPGKHDFKILKAISFPDGRSIRSDKPLMPARDCIFQFDDPLPFKLFTYSNDVGVLLICNISDTNKVEGTFCISDIENIQGDMFVLYDYFEKDIQITGTDTEIPVSLKKMGYKLYYAIPFTQPIVPIGLISKYNTPKTIRSVSYSEEKLTLSVLGEGPLVVASTIKPYKISGSTGDLSFEYQDQLLIIDIPEIIEGQTVEIFFNREK